MAKTRTRFVCSDCGHVTGQWVGQCPSCKAWNTVTEFKESANPRLERAAVAAGMAEARPLRDYTEQTSARVGTGEGEFNRVLGGGLVAGALVLLGGRLQSRCSSLWLARQRPCSWSSTVLFTFLSQKSCSASV